MKTEAAVLWGVGQDWSVEEIELDAPKDREVLVRFVAAGLCHSDEHLLTGDMAARLPIIGGHEGSGIVEAVGPGVTMLAPGDHVLTSFYPICGTCPPCTRGRYNLCDNGAGTTVGFQISDGTARHHARGEDLGIFTRIGSFARHTVGHETSFIKIDKDIPLDKAALVSCGFTTGWGSMAIRAGVRPGEDVAVVGTGGLGMAAVQAARMAGAGRIFAVDTVAFKREKALEFGATHTAASIEEAFELIRRETWGVMCDKVVMTIGVGHGDLIGSVFALAGKGGRVVITNSPQAKQKTVTLSLLDLIGSQKELVGSCFGGANYRTDIPMLLRMYQQGKVDLDGMITRRYSLDQINQGYQDMRDGKNIRGVIVYDA